MLKLWNGFGESVKPSMLTVGLIFFSLFQAKDIRSEEGYMLVDPVIVDIPQTAEERENLRTN